MIKPCHRLRRLVDGLGLRRLRDELGFRDRLDRLWSLHGLRFIHLVIAGLVVDIELFATQATPKAREYPPAGDAFAIFLGGALGLLDDGLDALRRGLDRLRLDQL